MITLNYDPRVVLALFTQAKPGKLKPTADEIQTFDRNLKSAVEAELLLAMARAGIPVTVENKSRVLAYRPNMPGDDNPEMISNACTFFLNTADFLGSPVGPESFGPDAAAPRKAAKKKAAPRKKTAAKRK